MRRLALCAAILLTATACARGNNNSSTNTTRAQGSDTSVAIEDLDLQLVQLAVTREPTVLVPRAVDDVLYIGERRGRVRALEGNTLRNKLVLDITNKVGSSGREQGLLGLAFSLDGSKLYVHYTNKDGNTVLSEFPFNDMTADAGEERVLLQVDQPFSNHNGGQLTFGPDGNLYLGLGDGGSAGDPSGNAQNLSSLLGKILRIDPEPSETQPYQIPNNNPFIDTEDARPEIWAYGLRNPWRFSFDRQTNDLWIGDVGQDSLEEVDFSAFNSAFGANFGWNALEGTQTFRGNAPQNAVPPVYEYPLDNGACAVTGGNVYRGNEIAALQGTYVFADFCVGDVLGLQRSDQGITVSPLSGLNVSQLSSFGQDNNGNLYVLSLDGPIYRLAPA